MTEEETTAPAEQEYVTAPKPKRAKPKAPDVIKGARTTRIREGGKQVVAVIYEGNAPEIGQAMQFLLANGVTYQGTVKDFTDADGEILVEFSDRFRPVAPK